MGTTSEKAKGYWQSEEYRRKWLASRYSNDFIGKTENVRRLTPEQVAEIRSAMFLGKGSWSQLNSPKGATTVRALAEKFGVSQTAIRCCRDYKTYQHLP